MKRGLKYFIRGTILLMVLALSVIHFLGSRFNPNFNVEDIDALVSTVESAPPLPDELYAAYQERGEVVSNRQKMLEMLMQKNELNCPCLDLASFRRDLYIGKKPILANRYWLAEILETKLSQRQCFNYWVQHFDFLNHNIGVEQAAQFYFNKTLDHCSEQELQTLCLMLENPAKYNPKRAENEKMRAKYK